MYDDTVYPFGMYIYMALMHRNVACEHVCQ